MKTQKTKRVAKRAVKLGRKPASQKKEGVKVWLKTVEIAHLKKLAKKDGRTQSELLREAFLTMLSTNSRYAEWKYMRAKQDLLWAEHELKLLKSKMEGYYEEEI